MTKASKSRIERKVEKKDFAHAMEHVVKKLEALTAAELGVYSVLLTMAHHDIASFDAFFDDTIAQVRVDLASMAPLSDNNELPDRPNVSND